MRAAVQVGREASVAEVLEHEAIGATVSGWLVLGVGDQPDGVVTEDQLRAVPPSMRAATPVGVLATPLERLRIVDHGALLVGVFDAEDEAGQGAVVVTIGDRPVGVVTDHDLAALAGRRAKW